LKAYLFVLTAFFGGADLPVWQVTILSGARFSASERSQACPDVKSPSTIALIFMACAAMPQALSPQGHTT
jgi:hypothetical protein